MTQAQSKQASGVVNTDSNGGASISAASSKALLKSGPVEVLRRPADASATLSSESDNQNRGGKSRERPADEKAAVSAQGFAGSNDAAASGPAAHPFAAVTAVKGAQDTARADADDSPRADGDTASDAAGLSAGRGELDLRVLLNQKEAELIALREELSARDWVVLELNETSIALERSRLEVCEQLEQISAQLAEAKSENRAHEAARKLAKRRTGELKAAFRSTEAKLKQQAEAELETVQNQHAAELEEQAAAHESKLEELEQNHAAALGRVQAQHAIAKEQAEELHSEALRAVEEAGNDALSKLVSTHKQEVRALQVAHEKALARAAASHAATLEATMAEAASAKATALAEVEGVHRATVAELSAAQATVKFLERSQANQAAVIERQESKITALEESLSQSTEKASAAADTLLKLRGVLGSGQRLLAASSLALKSEEPDAPSEAKG